MKKNLLTSPIFALLAASLIWGIGMPILKLGLQNVSLPTFAFIKFFGGALLFLPLALRSWARIPSKEFFALLASSLVGISLANYFLFAGLVKAPSINASLIYLLHPILLYLFTVELQRKRMGNKLIVGIILAIFGATIVMARPSSGGFSHLSGNMYFLLFVLFDALGTLMVKPFLRQINPYQITFIKLFLASLPFAFFGIGGVFSEFGASWSGLLALGYGIIFNTAISYYLFSYGLRWIHTSRVGLYSYMEPLGAVIVAFVLLGETPDVFYALGGLLIFAGIYLAEGNLLYHVYLRLHHHHR
jgi:drug/metabolite transporter (DMT)-like permease